MHDGRCERSAALTAGHGLGGVGRALGPTEAAAHREWFHRGETVGRAAGNRGLSNAWRNRLVALLLLTPCVALLLVAGSLTPDPRGFGTHTQLGLSPCSWKVTLGLPCATCGMTTAFSHAAHGQFLAAAAVQPAGAVLVLLTAMGVLVFGYAAVTGVSLEGLGRALWRPRSVLGLTVLILAAWAYTLGIALGL